LLWFPMTAAALALACRSERLAAAALLAKFFAGLVLDVVYVGSMKGIFRRKRPPYSTHKAYQTVIKVDSFSMPSGHTSRSVFVALFALLAARRAVHGTWAAAPICVWATATAFSRVIMGRHYLLDVAVGAAVGTLNACSLDLLLSETALRSLLQSALS